MVGPKNGECGCHCSTGKVFADFMGAGNYSDPQDALEDASGSAIEIVLPDVAADLDDCGLYTIGCFNRQSGGFGVGSIFTLSAGQITVVADWVNAGGKLLCTVDYHEWPALGQFGLNASYYTALESLISQAGGTLTFGAEDTTGGPAAPWPVGTFDADAWTTGITTGVEYDGDAGSSIANGTQLFTPHAKNMIVKEQCGAGWVVCHGSQNSLWGNQDISQGTPTNFTAMRQFLEFLWNL